VLRTLRKRSLALAISAVLAAPAFAAPPDPRIEALEARMQALEQSLAQTRAELEALKAGDAGKPAAKDEVLNSSDDGVEPDMINLVDLIAAEQRYSYRFDGNGQVLDHVLITQSLMSYVHGFGYARVNADFPESFRVDDTRAERYSDHDAAVAYFNLDEAPPKAAPTPTP